MRNLLFASTALALVWLPGTVAAQQATPGQPGVQTQQNQVKPGEGADIKVQQPAPQITVQQPPPQVTIEQPKPQVTVEQAKPEVTVQQAKPEVTVQQAKPEVNVVPGGTAQGTVGQSGQMATGTMPAGQAEQLIGNDVYSAGGEEMGEVENLIVNAQGEIKGLVVQWGGFLGIGDKERVVPWNQVRYDHSGDRVVIDMTKEQIQALAPYDGPRSVADMGPDARPLR
ncbi:MAG TPA: PRC-barrel domain-containing protein [Azospirillum sp.]